MENFSNIIWVAKKKLNCEIEQLKNQQQKLTKKERKEKGKYKTELIRMKYEDNVEDYLYYLKLILEKKTDKSEMYYCRICELEFILTEITEIITFWSDGIYKLLYEYLF
jgi:hypothetical protein